MDAIPVASRLTTITVHHCLRLLVVGILTAAGSQFSTCFGQGSLTPPGAPAPTFKTLSQVEPRIPISTFGTNLTASGSYYLTTNLYNGSSIGDAITIKTNMRDITIDLNGFSIISTNPAGGPAPVGVRISEATNIMILNGRFDGFDRAIKVEGAFYGILIENVHAQGCRRAGIEADGVTGVAVQTVTIRN